MNKLVVERMLRFISTQMITKELPSVPDNMDNTFARVSAITTVKELPWVPARGLRELKVSVVLFMARGCCAFEVGELVLFQLLLRLTRAFENLSKFEVCNLRSNDVTASKTRMRKKANKTRISTHQSKEY